MKKAQYNKKKIFNDPIYGFVSLPFDMVFDLIEHPYFQRLRRIKQLGLTHLVYPGALHTRFHHAIGAMHLMTHAIEVLRSKGNEISEEEAEGVVIAILLHDIGHGPFSHALEYSIVKNVTHEDISAFFMDKLNKEYKGRLSIAIRIFRNEYHKRFLHQLVSSQLDMDRLDYLKRDSFYTGVSEGVVNSDRIITMLNVVNDELVVEAKGIYSIEKFIIARRLMYWQVYLHKTVVSAEILLVQILQRAKELAKKGVELFATPPLRYFLYQDVDLASFRESETPLEQFAKLDDYDIFSSIKVWQDHEDKTLAYLCSCVVGRNLYRVELHDKKVPKEELDKKLKELNSRFDLKGIEPSYLVRSDVIENNAYNPQKDKINLLRKDGSIVDIAEAADQLNISVLSKSVKKYYFCFPK